MNKRSDTFLSHCYLLNILQAVNHMAVFLPIDLLDALMLLSC